MPTKLDHSVGPTYAIVYGMAEGAFHSRNLRRVLEAAGFQPSQPHEADVVITHSGGCYIVPHDARAKLFLHINPPYWPSKPMLASAREKLVYDFRLRRQRHQLRRWAVSLAANGMYFLNPRQTLRMIWPYITAKRTFDKLPDSMHVFLRTHIDSYCDPKALLKVTGGKHSYLTLAGHHDDCWREPEQYLKVIKSLYN